MDILGRKVSQWCGTKTKIQKEYFMSQEETVITEDLWTLGKNEIELDLAQTILEMSHIARPTHQVHENESDCDQSMLGFINNESEEESKKTTDPRWDALKNL